MRSVDAVSPAVGGEIGLVLFDFMILGPEPVPLTGRLFLKLPEVLLSCRPFLMAEDRRFCAFRIRRRR